MRTQKLFMKKVVTLGFIFLMACSFTFAQKTNFSGNWKFNEGKSQMGEGRFRMAAAKLIITQDDNTLNIERTGTRQDGETYSMKEKYTLDGKESENTMFGNNVRKSTVTWAADNKSLTINSTSTFERNGEKMERKSSEVYKLSDDGKTLTIESTSTGRNGEVKQTLVYDKE